MRRSPSARSAAAAIAVALPSLVAGEWSLGLSLTVGGGAGGGVSGGSGIAAGPASVRAYPSAEEAVPSFLTSGDGSHGGLRVRGVESSDVPCFALYSGGHSAGTGPGGGYLLPESGLVLSTGDPHGFVLDGAPADEETGEGRRRRRMGTAQDSDEDEDPLAECYLEFEISCASGGPAEADFSFVFGSDLYSDPDLGGGGDSQFGIYVNGKNVATLPGGGDGGGDGVSVGTVNASSGSGLYIDNTDAAYPDIGAAGITGRIDASGELPGGDGRWTTVRLALESYGADVDAGASWAAVRGSPIRCDGGAGVASSVVVEDVPPSGASPAGASSSSPTASPAPTAESEKKRKVQFWNPLTGEKEGLPVPEVPKEVAVVVSSLFFFVALAMVMCAAAKRGR